MQDPLAVIEKLAREAGGTDFFAAMRTLERTYRQMPRIGTSATRRDDPFRLGQAASTEFNAAGIATVEPANAFHPSKIVINFFGVMGPNGPMPIHFTEYVRDREKHENDPTWRGFLDVFHHRMLGIFYRSWTLGRPAVALDRPESDRFAGYLDAMLGMRQPAFRGRSFANDQAKRFYTALLVSHNKSAVGLEKLLAHVFAVPVKVHSFRGSWLALEEQDRCRLDRSSSASQLGRTAILGSSVWNTQHSFRIAIGPVDFAAYQSFLPASANREKSIGSKSASDGAPESISNLARLRDWVRQYVGDVLAWDLQLILKKEDVPRARLTGGMRLGMTTWLASTSDSLRDRGELVLRPESAK
jgi:type VI secretion system protein ImpH